MALNDQLQTKYILDRDLNLMAQGRPVRAEIARDNR